jgi:hypothetical protein
LSPRIDKSWLVLNSIENFDGSRCVDIFRRDNGTFGFEEFRRDAEDAGLWTPVAYFSAREYRSIEEVVAIAETAVIWLRDPDDRRALFRP